MSYQFEDDSAMDELLAKQLDRHSRKQQPSTRLSQQQQQSASSKTASSSQFRPTTAGSTSLARQSTVIEREAPTSLQDTGDMAPSRGKLASWLVRDDQGQPARKVSTTMSELEITIPQQQRITNLSVTQNDDMPANIVELERTLTETKLQEMSKQRLVQLILEQVVPSLHSLRQAVASRHSASETLEQLTNELKVEQNRVQVVEMRHEEMLKLVEQKWTQVNGQLEKRLETSESERDRLMAKQRDDLEKLDRQYQDNLARLSENYELRMRDEQTRFDELIKRRDAMHKLELESKLNVNFDLVKLETIQSEWQKSLELTIGQLNDQFKSIGSLLDKQALQVNGTNLELIKRSKQLYEQYERHEASSECLQELAGKLNELVPKLTNGQQEGELVLRETRNKLTQFVEFTSDLKRREEALERARCELDKQREQLQEGRVQLQLDSSRVELKEERLNELIKSNNDCETRLTNQRNCQIEEQAHLQTKRVHLDEKANELREQNYALHLLRKKLTSQQEELMRAQMKLEREQTTLKEGRAEMGDETNRLEALKERVRRETDQLKRLQHSLVCSLCMSRLFGSGGGGGVIANNQSIEPAGELLLAAAAAADQLDQSADLSLGRLIKCSASDKRAYNIRKPTQAQVGPVLTWKQQQRHIERNTSLVAAERKYVELLTQAN